MLNKLHGGMAGQRPHISQLTKQPDSVFTRDIELSVTLITSLK